MIGALSIGKWARRAAAILLTLLAGIALIVGIFSGFGLFDTSGVDFERTVLLDFKQAETFVQNYQTRQNHLPSNDDLDAWIEHTSLDSARIGGLMVIRPAPIRFCTEKNDQFESVPGDRFVLSIWRGEFYDCYASPSGKNTLVLSKTEWLKQNLRAYGLITATLLVAGVTLLLGGVWLFRWRPKPT